VNDPDGDGICCADDNCCEVDNEDQADSDGDGVGDACDNCVDDANTDQANWDEDAYGDVCDNCPYLFDEGELSADSDGDGVGDACDNCVDLANTDQTNSDSDSLGDDCDNCPTEDNESQDDVDADGVGDACDVCPMDAENDIDQDGYCCAPEEEGVPRRRGEPLDNCCLVENPDQADFDNDNFGDVCDQCSTGAEFVVNAATSGAYRLGNRNDLVQGLMLQQIVADHCEPDDWLRFDFDDEASNVYLSVKTDGSASISGYAIGFFSSEPEERFGCTVYMSYEGGVMNEADGAFEVNNELGVGFVECVDFTVSLNSMATPAGNALSVFEADEVDVAHGAGWVVPINEPCAGNGLVEKPFRDWIFTVGDCDDEAQITDEWVAPEDCEDPDGDNICGDADTCPWTYDPSNDPAVCSGTGRVGSDEAPPTAVAGAGSATGLVIAGAAVVAVAALLAGVVMKKKSASA